MKYVYRIEADWREDNPDRFFNDTSGDRPYPRLGNSNREIFIVRYESTGFDCIIEVKKLIENNRKYVKNIKLNGRYIDEVDDNLVEALDE